MSIQKKMSGSYLGSSQFGSWVGTGYPNYLAYFLSVTGGNGQGSS